MKTSFVWCANLILLFLIVNNRTIQAQQIVAGVVSSSDLYTDIPDNSVNYLDSTAIDTCNLNRCLWSDVFKIDIDANGTDDFMITTQKDSSFSNGSMLFRLSVVSLNPIAQISAYSDNTNSTVGAQSTLRVASINNYGDIINSDSTYDSQSVDLAFSVYYGGSGGGESLQSWNAIGDAYIGFRLNLVDTAYGWIRVVNSFMSLTVKDYAINDPTLSSFKIGEVANDPIQIYPNPVKEQLIIEIEATTSPLSMTIYNSQGQIVEDRIFEAKQLQIDCSTYPVGIYYVRLVSENKIYNKKIVKER